MSREPSSFSSSGGDRDGDASAVGTVSALVAGDAVGALPRPSFSFLTRTRLPVAAMPAAAADAAAARAALRSLRAAARASASSSAAARLVLSVRPRRRGVGLATGTALPADAATSGASTTTGACTGLNSALLVTTTAPSAYTAPVRSPVRVYATRPDVWPAWAAAAATVAAKGFSVDTEVSASVGARAPSLVRAQSRALAVVLAPRARRASTTRAISPAQTTKPPTAPREAAMIVEGPLWGPVGWEGVPCATFLRSDIAEQTQRGTQ